MLVAQAARSSERFTGAAISTARQQAVVRQLSVQMQNIILVGMPGCGKTTVGQQLAQELGKKFVDADQALEETTGRRITDILPSQGEAAFRALETQTLSDLGKQSGLVIATGGGCVTREENYDLLHQNGTVFWLTRELNKLPTQGRPLSRDLGQMYARREPMYRRFADAAVSNDGSVEQTVREIRRIWEENL